MTPYGILIFDDAEDDYPPWADRAAHTDAHSSAPWRSPEGEETATSATSPKTALQATKL